jgi:hypothetical protein
MAGEGPRVCGLQVQALPRHRVDHTRGHAPRLPPAPARDAHSSADSIFVKLILTRWFKDYPAVFSPEIMLGFTILYVVRLIIYLQRFFYILKSLLYVDTTAL